MTGAADGALRSGRRGSSVHRCYRGPILSRDELARERAASMRRQRPIIEARIQAARERRARQDADPSYRVNLSHPSAFRDLICNRCGAEFSERRKHGAPHRYCTRCR